MSNRKSLKNAKSKDSTSKASEIDMSKAKFDFCEFILKHLRIGKCWKDFGSITYEPPEVIRLLDCIIPMLKAEPTVQSIYPPVTIVGDLNGHFYDLTRILNIRTENDVGGVMYPFLNNKYIFLGDYTEANFHNVETICLLFALKVLFGKRFTLLRGHQETLPITERTPFLIHLENRFPRNYTEIWEKFHKAFEAMPIAAIVGGKILCVHSGISPEIGDSLDKLKKMDKPTTIAKMGPLARDVLFACPISDDAIGADSDEPTFFTSSKNQRTFNGAVVERFCEKTKIQLIVRSHEVPMKGFKFFSKQRMLTIFTVAKYGDCCNEGAFLRVDGDGNCKLIQLRNSSFETDPGFHVDNVKRDPLSVIGEDPRDEEPSRSRRSRHKSRSYSAEAYIQAALKEKREKAAKTTPKKNSKEKAT